MGQLTLDLISACIRRIAFTTIPSPILGKIFGAFCSCIPFMILSKVPGYSRSGVFLLPMSARLRTRNLSPTAALMLHLLLCPCCLTQSLVFCIPDLLLFISDTIDHKIFLCAFSRRESRNQFLSAGAIVIWFPPLHTTASIISAYSSFVRSNHGDRANGWRALVHLT
jgi:hypothetical protein